MTFLAVTPYHVGVFCFTVQSHSQLTRRRSVRLGAFNTAAAEEEEPLGDISIWPCMDRLDRRLIKIALPCIANFAISPLIGAVDLFWVNRMGNALAVAGQAAANQVFSSAFWLASFLPSGKLCTCCPHCLVLCVASL